MRRGNAIERTFGAPLRRRAASIEVSVGAATGNFYRLFELVKSGKRVIVRRRGKPIVTLEKVVQRRRLTRRRKSNERARRR